MKFKRFISNTLTVLGFYSVILSSCVSSSPLSVTEMAERVVVHDKLQKYFDEFIALCEEYPESRKHCKKRLTGFIGLGFGPMDTTKMVGYCLHLGSFFNYISYSSIHEEYFNELPEFQKRDLVFHELGHCLLGLDHTEDGIMKSSLSWSWDYKYNWERHLHEMFSRKNQVEF